jgi:hypothetical protein
VGIVTTLRTEQPRNGGWTPGTIKELFSSVVKPPLQPIQPPPMGAAESCPSLETIRPECETNSSHPASAEVKKCVELYFHAPILHVA